MKETQRVIKFRTYEPVFGMHKPWDLKMMTEFIPKSGERVLEKVWCEGTVFMQWTGLQDSKGVDIYEGDIIKSFSGKYVVRFYNGCFCVLDGNEHYPLFTCPQKEIEVIGHIYDPKFSNLL